jgi:predicted kinase
MTNKQLILLRGPSGSGKSTISKNIIFNKLRKGFSAAVYEADQFFTHDIFDTYHFDASKLKSAHKWCQLNTERSMLLEIGTIVVSNTFIAHWEMESYIKLAQEYGYDVRIIRTPQPWNPEILFQRNKHAVPMDVIQRHANNYQYHNAETEWSDMSIFNE